MTNIPLGGKPEYGASAGDGKVYANLTDTSEVVEIDAKAAAVARRWSTAPCKQPVAMAIDTAHHRLFSGCRSGVMAVSDYPAGRSSRPCRSELASTAPPSTPPQATPSPRTPMARSRSSIRTRPTGIMSRRPCRRLRRRGTWDSIRPIIGCFSCRRSLDRRQQADAGGGRCCPDRSLYW